MKKINSRSSILSAVFCLALAASLTPANADVYGSFPSATEMQQAGSQAGMNQMHDIVDDCFAFEKVQSMDDNNRMSWNHSWWGYMMFPELQVK